MRFKNLQTEKRISKEFKKFSDLIQAHVRNVINNEFNNKFPGAPAVDVASGGPGGPDLAGQTLDDLQFKVKALQERLTDELTRVISDGKENAKIIAQELIVKNNNENKNQKSDFSNFEKKLDVIEDKNNENPEISEIDNLKFKYKQIDERMTEQLDKIIKLIDSKKNLDEETPLNENKSKNTEDSSVDKEKDAIEILSGEIDSLKFKVKQTNERITDELKIFLALINEKKKK